MSTIRRILLATDFSPCSASALDVALELVGALRARLLVMHVWSPPVGVAETMVRIDGDREERVSLREHVGKEAEHRFAEFLEVLEQRGVRDLDPLLVEGDPVRNIIDASLGVDLVVLGSHGRGALGRLVLGSVAERVARQAHCPVLIARPREA